MEIALAAARAGGQIASFAPDTVRPWRCVGLFALHEARDTPYAVFIHVHRKATADLARGILLARVAVHDALVPWLLSPAFEHWLGLTARPDAGGYYGIACITGAPDYASDVWGKRVQHHGNKRGVDVAAVMRDGLNEQITLPQLALAYTRSCVMPTSGGMCDWQWSPQSAPVRCQLVRAHTEDPIGRWMKRPTLRTTSNGDTMRILGPHLVFLPTTVAALWAEYAQIYGITEQRAFAAISGLVLGQRTGAALVLDHHEAIARHDAAPVFPLHDALVAWEREEPTRSVLGAYALLCIDNALRPMTARALLEPHNALPLPPPIVETPTQAHTLHQMLHAQTLSELPRLRDMALLLTRSAVRPATSRGAMAALPRVEIAIVQRIASDLAVTVLRAYIARLFAQYGSTGKLVNIETLLADSHNVTIASILGDGCSIIDWLHGTDRLFAVRAADITTLLHDRLADMSPRDTTPYFAKPLTPTTSPFQLVAIASPWQATCERECIERARSIANHACLRLLPLTTTKMGGAGAVEATLELLRLTTSLRAAVIVTPYCPARRIGHFARVLGYTTAQTHQQCDLRNIVLSAETVLRGDNAQLAGDCSTLVIESAHLFTAQTMSELLALSLHVGRLMHVILVGATALVPPDPRVNGAAFRDIVRELPACVVTNGPPTLAPDVRVDEAAMLQTAVVSWRTFDGAPLVRFSHERPDNPRVRHVVSAARERLPYTAHADLVRRSPAVLHDYDAGLLPQSDTATSDLACQYFMLWSELAWMSRGELLVLLSHGHAVTICNDNNRKARNVAFPNAFSLPTNNDAIAQMFAAVYADVKFGTFRTTAWELLLRHMPTEAQSKPLLTVADSVK